MTEKDAERKRRQAESTAKYQAKPEVRKRRAEDRAKRRRTDPEFRKREAERQAKYRAKPEVRKRKAEYRAKPEVRKRTAEYKAKQYRAYRANPEIRQRQAEQHRISTYDLFPAEYYFMLAGHQFRCWCCDTDEPGGKKGWHVDHCHVTGKVRGILCTRCNGGIGFLGDNAAGVRRALAYLERFENGLTQNNNTEIPATTGIDLAA